MGEILLKIPSLFYRCIALPIEILFKYTIPKITDDNYPSAEKVETEKQLEMPLVVPQEKEVSFKDTQTSEEDLKKKNLGQFIHDKPVEIPAVAGKTPCRLPNGV